MKKHIPVKASRFLAALLIPILSFFWVEKAMAQTPVPMASQPGLSYTESFGSISTWANNFTGSGSGENRWKGIAAQSTGSTAFAPNPVIINQLATTLSGSTVFATSSTGGVQRGGTGSTAYMIFLATGSNDNTSATAVDFFMDFTGVNAGTLSFTAAELDNGTSSNRQATLKVYYSTDGTTFTELTGTNLPYTVYDLTASSANISVSLPSAFNNVSTARLRFYVYNGGTPPTTPAGSRPKITIDNLTVTATSSGCSSAPTSVSATPSSTILCTGATLTLTAAATGATSYSWSGPNSFSSTAQVASLTVSTLSAGTYTLSATNACGTTTVSSVAITINTPPTGVSATPSTTSLCSGSTLTLTGAASGAISYLWSGPNSYTSTLLSPAAFTVGTASGSYTLAATNSCGTTSVATTAVTVLTSPTGVSATPSASTLCSGATLTLTGAATGATTFAWAGPGGFTSTLLSPAAFTVGTASAGIYTLTASNSCGSVTATTAAITISTSPTSVTATASPTTLCSGSTVTLTGTATGATSYGWSGPNSYASTLLNPASFTVSTLSAGIYTLSATNSCGTTTGTTTSVTVNGPPSAPTFTGTATIAYGNSTTLSLSGGANDVVYYWNGAGTSSTTLSAGGTRSFTVAPSSTTTYSVTSVTSTAGCTLSSITSVTVTITVTGSPSDTIPTMDDNMAMGNPSSATTSTSDVNNYLIVKPQYALSYNNSKGEPNWVSWHLSTAWKGSAARCNCFAQDSTLPTGYYRASTSNYTSTGFDRGHMCPSDDRDFSDTDNLATFRMTNICPQAPNLNQITWESLESYCRALIYAGNELYIISGGYGSGGTGTAGSASSIASGAINVPSRYFKVIIVLPVGTNDVSRVTTSTRVIAVDMPNNQTVNSQPWGYYRTSVDAIEATTGYDFFSNVPTGIQSVIEAGVDNGPTSVLAWDLTGTGGDATFVATSVNSNLDTTTGLNTLTRGSSAAASTGANSFRTTGFQNDGISTANTDYFQVKIKPVSGKRLSLSTIDATCTGTTSFAATPGVTSQFAYSFDGTTYTLIGSPIVSVGTPANLTTVNVSSITALQNISSTATLYIRYYASGQTTTGGWGFYSQYSGNYGLAFDGSFTDEPCSTAPTSVTATLSSATVCSGGTVTLTGTATSVGTTTYSWSGPNSFTSTDLTPASFTAGTVTAGIYTLVATNSCGSTTATTATLTVDAGPTAVSATPSATSICSGSTITLTGAATGATSYSWSGPNGFSSTLLSPASFTVGTASAGIYSLTAANSCGSTSATTASVAVLTVPTVAAISGSTSVAAGSIITLTNATAGGTWVSGTTSVATVTSGGAVTGVTAGSSVISYTVANICGSATATLSVTVTTPVTTIAAWDCTGASAVATLSATIYNTNLTTASSANNLTRGSGAAASAGANSFRTAGFQNNGIATSNTDYFQATMTAATGYTLSLATIDARLNGTATYVGGAGASNQFAYSTDGTTFTLIGSPQVVTSAPATLTTINVSGISALQNVPAGTTVTIRFYASGNTTTGGWGFYSPASGAYGLAFGGNVTSAPACTGAPTAVTATPSATTLCSGNTLTLTGAATGAASYAWSGPNSFSSTALSPASFTVNTASAGVYTLVATNACGSTTVTTSAIAVNTSPTAVSATPSATTLCPGNTLTLTGAATGATSYAWSGPGSYSATDLNPAAFTVNTTSAGVYTLTATNSCGSTTATTAAITINVAPTAVSANTSATAICSGGTLTLTGAATGATSYAWSGPDSYTSTDVNPAGFTVSTASAGIYTLTASNSCGNTVATTAAVTINVTPTTVSASAVPTTLCTGNTLTLAGAATGATSYSWSGPGSYSATDLNPAAFTVNTASAGVYTLTATNGCGNTTATTATITVNPLPAPTIGGSAIIAYGASTTLTFSGVTGDVVNYSWTGGGSASTTIGVSGISIITVSPTATTTYAIDNATSTAGCSATITGQSATVTVDLGCTIAPTSVSATLSAGTVCTGNTLTLTGAATNALTYSWSGPNSFTSTDLNPASFTVNTASAGVYTLTATNLCGSTTVTTSALSVITVPTAVSATPSSTSLCSGTTLTLTGAATGAISYSWSGPNGFTATDMSPAAFTVGTINAGIYSLTATNSCGSTNATTASITVTTSPTVAAISGGTSVAVGSNLTLTNATAGGTWVSGTTSVATVTAGGVVRGVTAGSSVISYTVANICGSATATLSVTVTTPVTTIAAWDCTGASAVATLSATIYNTNLTTASSANNLTRGSGAAASAGSNSFRTAGFQNNGIATSNTDYFQATMTAATGYTLSLATIDARLNGTATYVGGAGASNQFAYSTDGTTFTLIGSPQVVTSAPATLTTINVSGISALQNVPAGTTVTIRFYASGNTTTGGWGFYSPASGAYGLAFGGNVTSAPACTGAPTAVTATPSATTLCSGNTLTLTGAATGAVSYAWSGPNSFSSTALSPASFTVNTASAGVYTLVATNACGSTTVTTSAIAVNTSPTAVSATPSATALCPGNTLTLTGAATGATSYAWSGPNSYSATDLNPATFTVNTASAGVYTLTATNSCGNTIATTATVNVSTGPTAVTATPSATTLCVGNTLTLTGTATGADAYSWSGPNSFSSTNLNPASFTASAAAAGIYTLTATNSCGSTAATTTAITINDVPSAVTATPAAITLCSGNTLTLTGAATGATSYAWSGPGSYSAGSLIASLTVNTAASGIYTLTATNSCGNTIATTSVVTVNGLPAPTIAGTATILTGSNTTLTFTGNSGDVVNYSWTGGGSATTTIGVSGTNILTVSPTATTTYSIDNATSASGCVSSITGQTATITVDLGCSGAPTAVSATLSTGTLCVGNTLTLTGAATGASSYSWSGPNSYSATDLNPASFTVGTAAAGVYTLTATNACGSTTATTGALTVNTLPTAVSTTPSATSLCSGSTLTLTGTATGATSYSWSGPNGFSSTLLSPASFTVGTASAGIYSLTATNSCGSTNATTASIAVLTVPTVAAISGGSTVVAGNNLTLTNATSGGTWVSGTTSVATVTAGGVVRGVTAGSSVISYTVSNICGSATATLSVTVTTPVTTIAAWDCTGAGNYTTLAATIYNANLTTASSASNLTRGSGAASSAGANSFRTVGFQNNGIATSNTDYFQATMTAATGYTLSLATIDARLNGTATYVGGAGASNQFAYSTDGTTFTLIGSPQVVTSAPATLTTINVSGISALQNLPAGTTVTIRFYASGNTTTGGWGFYSPAAAAYGLAFGGNVNAVVTCTGAPTAVTATPSATTLCSGNTLTLTGAATGAASYAWSGPNSFSSTALSPASFTVNTASAGVYTLVATNACGSTTVTTSAVAVNTAPTTVSATPSAITLCSGSTLTLTGAATGATSYAWSGPSSFTSTDLNPASFMVNTASAGVYTLTATNSCGNTIANTATVNVSTSPTTVTATPSATSICSGNTFTLTGNATGATSYSWSGPSSFTSTNLNPAGFTASAASAGSYTLTASNSCGSTTATAELVAVNEAPSAATASASATTLCAGNTLTLTGTATGATTYSWSGPGGYSSTDINPAAFTVSTASTGIYTLTVANGCGSITATTAAVTVNDVPTVVTATASAASVCSGGTLTLTGTATSADSYSWSGPGSFTSTDLNPAGFTVTTAGAYTLTATNFCGNAIATTAPVTIGTSPMAVSATPSATTLCVGSTLTLTGAATDATSYSWSGPNGFTATDLNPAAFTTGTVNAGIYSLTATNSCGSTSAVTASIAVITSPTVAAISGSTSVAVGSNLTLTDATPGGTWTSATTYAATVSASGVVRGVANGASIISYTVTNICGSAASTLSVSVTPVVAEIIGWDVNANSATYGPSPFAPTTLNSNLTTISGLNRGAGVATTGTAANRAWGGTDWQNTSAATAVTNGDTINYVVKPNAGYKLSLSSFVLSYRRPTSGPTAGELQYSVNGAAYTTASVMSYSSTSSSGATLAAINLSGITALQNIPSTSNVKFRIANYGGTGTSGTWYIFDVGNSTASDMYFTGTVAVDCSIPPSITATPSATSLCIGSTLTLTGTATNAVSYSWSGPNGFASTALSPASFTVSTASAGSYTLVASNACGTVTTVTTPSVSVITTPGSGSTTLSATTLCAGSTLSLTGSAPDATSYSWSGPGGFTATGATPAAFTVNTASAGVYTLTATNSCGSSSVTSTALTVNGLPAPTISGTTTVILGSGTTLTFSGTNGDVVNYAWTGGGSATTTIDVSGTSIVSVTPVTTTTYSITSATNALGCGATITGQQATVTVDPGCTGAPTSVTASLSSASICTGGTLTLTGTATDGISYSWSGPGGYTATGLNPVGFTVTGPSAGIYTLAATNSCGTTTVTTAALAITTIPTSVTASTSVSSLCAGGTFTLTASATGATSYSWSGPGSYSATDATPAGITASTATGGTYTVTAGNSCGNTTATTSVTVIPTPTVSAVSPASASVATGNQLTLTNATPGGTWTSSDLAVAGINTSGVMTAFNVGTATMTYTLSNACGTATATSAITATAPTDGTIYLNNFGATTATASDAPAVLNANLTTPTPAWTGTTAFTSFTGATGQALSFTNSSGTPSYTLTLNVASGYTLSVSSFNFWRNHSASGASHWVLSVNGTNVGSGDLTGTTGAYVGTTAVSTPITGLTGTVTVKLQLSGATGTGTFRLDDFQLNGIVQGHPLPVIATNPANDTIVSGDNSSFTVTASGAASYQWQRNTSGLTGGTWTNISSATMDPTPGTYASYSTTTTATSNTLLLSTVPVSWNGYAYRCIVNNDGGSVTTSAAQLSVVTPPACTGTPTAGSATATTPAFCASGSSAIGTTGTTLATGLAYQWQSSSDSSSWNDISGATSTSYTTPTITTTTYYRMAVTCDATSLTGYTNGAKVTINASPAIVLPSAITLCSGTSGTLVIATGAATYSWTPATGLSATTGANVTINPTTSVIYTVTGTSTAGCVSTTTLAATYNNTPAAMAVTSPAITMCLSSAPQMLTVLGGSIGSSAVYSGSSVTINGGANAYSSSTVTASALPAGAYVTGVSVNFTASMPWQADYVINLVSPDGHVLNLANLRGIAAATTNSYTNTTVSSAGGATFPTGATVPAATTFRADAVIGAGGATYPSNAVNFNELLNTVNGTWRLVFYQATSFANANGTLNNWSLTFNYSRSITWSPTTNLYTDAAGTTPYTGTATDTVYAAAPATAGTVNYVATSNNGGCTSSATDTITVLNGPTISPATVPNICDVIPSVSVPYTTSGGTPTTYNITWSPAAISAGFANVTAAPLPGAALSITTPGVSSATGTFTGTVNVTDAICTGPSVSLSVTILPSPIAAVTSVDAVCSGHTGDIVITGTPSSTLYYMVDSGSTTTAIVDGSGHYTLNTGNITTPHNYTIQSVVNGICATAVDTAIVITPTIMQWLGGAAGHETDWNTAANWSCGFVPTIMDSVVINTVTHMPILPTTVSATVDNLNILSGSTIQLDGAAAINVKGDIYNSGTVNGTGRVILNGSSAQKLYGIGTISNLELNNTNGAAIQPDARTMISSTLYLTAGTLTTNDSLELLSNDTFATARIAEIPATGAAVAGRVKTDQFVPGGLRRYRFWGHCFSDTISLSQLMPFIDITGQGGSTRGFTTTTTNAPSAFWHNPYGSADDSTGYDPGWRAFNDIRPTAADSNKIHPGQGIRVFFRGNKGEGLGYTGYYGMYTPSAVTAKMIGHVNQGPVSIFLKHGAANQTLNQLSNPYPSPVDLGTAAYYARLDGQITGYAFYVWNPSIGAGGQYMAIPIGTSAPEPFYLPANTSYQVRADHDGAHLNFQESYKSAERTVNLFRAPANAVRLNVYDSTYHLWDMLSLQFNDKASDDEDKLMDAIKPAGFDFNFYSIARNGRKLAIDARPYEGDKVIPLGIKSAYQQDFVLRAEAITVPTGGAVTLHDKLLNKYVELKEGTEYRFSIGKEKATQGDDRFELSLKPTKAAVVKGLEVAMAPNPASDDVKITFTSGSIDNVSVRIMDVSGVSIYSQDLGAKQNGVITVPMSNFAAGVYMVELTLGEQKISKRLVKE